MHFWKCYYFKFKFNKLLWNQKELFFQYYLQGNSIIVYPNSYNKISLSIGCSISNKISFSIGYSISNKTSFLLAVLLVRRSLFLLAVLLVHTLSKCTYMFGPNGVHLWRYYCSENLDFIVDWAKVHIQTFEKHINSNISFIKIFKENNHYFAIKKNIL